MKAKTYISYLRVSTQRQGISGLGLEAQRAIIEQSVGKPIKEFVEVESGRKSDRPQLKAALEACNKENATLVVAKLDRLARNLNFLTALLDSKTEIYFCDFPQANKMVLSIIGAISQYEAELISARTKAALRAKRERGEKLGCKEKLDEHRATAIELSCAARRTKSESNSNNMRARAFISTLGSLSLREKAKKLNENGFVTSTGKQFSAMQVLRLSL